MRAAAPYPRVPGDSEDGKMRRSGTLMGMSNTLAVWRFGWSEESERGYESDVYITETKEGYGFLWVLATRKTGKIQEEWRGYALGLPLQYRSVLDWEPA